MDYFQVQDFFKKLYPNNQITFELDKKCIDQAEIKFTNGKPNPIHHVEYRKVKVTVQGLDPLYIDIIPHRQNYETDGLEKHAQIKLEVAA